MQSYLKITKYLDLTIKHYIQDLAKFKNNNYAPFHGDLSLIGNVMFNNDDEVYSLTGNNLIQI